MKQKQKLKKNPEWPTKKKFVFQIHQLSIFFLQNFRDWLLGEHNKLMQRALMWLNLYGCQAVQRKLKKGLKMHF